MTEKSPWAQLKPADKAALEPREVLDLLGEPEAITGEQRERVILNRTRLLVECEAPGRYAWSMDDYLLRDAASAGLMRNVDEQGVSEARRLRTQIGGETPATKLGTLIHAAILEPDRFESWYRVSETKGEGVTFKKDAWKALGGHFASDSEIDIALTARDNVHRHPDARELLNGIQREHVEQALVFDVGVGLTAEDLDEPEGREVRVRGKLRLDLARADLNVAADIKSTRRFSKYDWPFECEARGYDITHSWYRTGSRCLAQQVPGALPVLDEYLFIVVENSLPCRVAVRRLGNSSAELGDMRAQSALRAWATACARGRFPEPALSIETFELPERAFNAFGTRQDRRRDQ